MRGGVGVCGRSGRFVGAFWVAGGSGGIVCSSVWCVVVCSGV